MVWPQVASRSLLVLELVSTLFTLCEFLAVPATLDGSDHTNRGFTGSTLPAFNTIGICKGLLLLDIEQDE